MSAFLVTSAVSTPGVTTTTTATARKGSTCMPLIIPAGPPCAEALGSARGAERDADGHDHRAAERDVRHRPQEARLQEAVADPRERHELDRHDDRRRHERGVVARYQERERVEDAAGERAGARDDAAHDRAAATGDLARVREPFRVRHADPGRDRRGHAGEEGVPRYV